ncbi:response regulator [Geodermatophilus sabuli]|uniref:Response regulator n=1 Tax=Geodermatophilus sabuli TaxID=1564158 RepID=A0A7K3W691_9ACTN|nr:response regulator [Geodermatophilus sabuli]NEK60228.1 response regulator [Geodermatophilus sabuli]
MDGKMTEPTDDSPTAVLLIDDRSVIREAAEALLRPHGFDVHTVDAVDAFERALTSRTFAIVMIDYLLQSDPVKRRAEGTPNGLSLVTAVRATQPGARIVLFSEGLEQEMVLRQAREAGVDGMITKGDTWERVAHGLRQVLDPGVVEYVSPSLRRPSTPRQTGFGALTPAEVSFLKRFVAHPGTRAQMMADQGLTPGNFDALINSIKRKVTDHMNLSGDPRATGDRLISNEVLLQWAMERGVE